MQADDERLILAIEEGDIPSAQALLDRGANVNTRTSNQWTPLLTASRDQQEIVELLLRRGANPNLCSDMGYTPLMRAAGHGAIDIIKMLLATIERLGEHPIPELGGVCWIAILLIAELEKEFQTTRWAKSLLAHPAYLATLSERLSEIGNIAAALSVADQVENREARDISLGEVIKAQIQSVQFEAAINTAQRITDTESFCSALIEYTTRCQISWPQPTQPDSGNVNLDRGCTSCEPSTPLCRAWPIKRRIELGREN